PARRTRVLSTLMMAPPDQRESAFVVCMSAARGSSVARARSLPRVLAEPGPCSASRRRRSSVRFSRGRRRAVRRPGELHVHALLLQVAGEFLEALLTPEAAVLPAAERRAEVVRGAFVDPHVAHFEP